MSKPLIPIDATRCQAEIKEGSFMTLGPRRMQRCGSTPTWVAVDVQDGKFAGAMALCDSCMAVCKKMMPHVAFQQLTTGKKEG